MSGLKSVCPTCGTVHEDVQALNDALAKMAKENAGLRGQLTQMHRDGPRMDEVREVFEHWVERLGKRHDTVLGDARVKAVRARLKEGFTVERLKCAIDGCLLDDWAMGRVAKSGGKTFNDLAKHICHSDETVERFEEMASKPKLAPQPAKATPIRSQHVFHDPFVRPLDRALAALCREFGADCYRHQVDELFQQPDEWWARCPLHPEHGFPMRIRERRKPNGSLEVACANGCLPTVLMGAIRGLEDKARSWLVGGPDPVLELAAGLVAA